MKYQHQSGQYVSILKYQSKITPAMGVIHIIYGFQWSILNTVLNVGNLVMEIKLWIYGCFLKQGYPKTMVGNSYAHTWFCGMLHFLTHLRTPLGLVYTHRTTQDHTGVGLGWSFVGLCSLSGDVLRMSQSMNWVFISGWKWNPLLLRWSKDSAVAYQHGQLDQTFHACCQETEDWAFSKFGHFLGQKM